MGGRRRQGEVGVGRARRGGSVREANGGSAGSAEARPRLPLAHPAYRLGEEIRRSCQRLPPAAGFTGGETEAGREVVSQVLLTCRLLTWG